MARYARTTTARAVAVPAPTLAPMMTAKFRPLWVGAPVGCPGVGVTVGAEAVGVGVTVGDTKSDSAHAPQDLGLFVKRTYTHYKPIERCQFGHG